MNVLNFNKNNYTKMSQSRMLKTDFLKTIDTDTSTKISNFYRNAENAYRNTTLLSNTIKRFT